MLQATTDFAPRQQDIALIRNTFNTSKVFIDSSSLMVEWYPQLESLLFPLLRELNTTLIVPVRVVEEIKHFENDSRADLRSRAVYALQSIARQQKAGLIDLKGDENDSTHADNVFSCQFMKFRVQYNLVLITQDVKLAHDILNLNDVQSQRGKSISVFRVTRHGTLGRNDGNIELQKAARNMGNSQAAHTESQVIHNPQPLNEDKLFTVKRQITSIKDSCLSTSHFPQERDMVHALLAKQDHRLVKLLAKGGEGSVYTTDSPDLVCKIYSEENLTRFRLEKLSRMIGTAFDCPGVCWPTDIVQNREGKPVGYLMPKAQGIELQKSLFIPPLLKKHFGHWKKTDTVRLALNILEKIKYLHHHNIIIGDINPLNILVKSPDEIYFVDTDSYQIEDLPCFVGTAPFTAPELQGSNFKTFLRTHGNERFAVATLLFMIMLPGKHPYAQQGGEDTSTNIRKMDFSYPCGSKSNRKTPDGQWRFCWSHLPYKLKEAFYETFHHSGQYSNEDVRLNVTNWINLFSEYQWLLESGKFVEQDPQALELFPSRFKNASNAPLEICSLCKHEFPGDQLQNGYCKGCLTKGTIHKCQKCGKGMLYTNYQQHVLQKPPFSICSECFNAQNETYTTVTCIDCSANFTITYAEKDYFEGKEFELPKRCSVCRKQRKTGQQPVHSGATGYEATAASKNGAHGMSSNRIADILKTLFGNFK